MAQVILLDAVVEQCAEVACLLALGGPHGLQFFCRAVGCGLARGPIVGIELLEEAGNDLCDRVANNLTVNYILVFSRLEHDAAVTMVSVTLVIVCRCVKIEV